MAYVRKSRKPDHDPRPIASAAAATTEPAPPPDPDERPAAASPADDAVARLLRDQERAEELARMAPRPPTPKPPTVDEYVDSIPNLSAHKRSFLKAHPELLQGEPAAILTEVYNAAMASGWEDDTNELNEFILRTVGDEMTARRERLQSAARAARRSVEPEPVEMPPPTPPPAPARAATPPANARRSMPTVAPPTREIPTASGRRQANVGTIHLTAEERDIARASFSSDLSIAERERLYAMNKARLQRMREAGTYPEAGRG